MPAKPDHHLREWRKFRRMTVQALADALGTTKSTVSDLETFKLQLSPKWLRRISPILGVQQGYIIDYDPNELNTDIIEIWARIPEDDRPQAARVLESFTHTGTDG